MARIRIDFCDFWPGFSRTDNFFVETLSRRFDVEVTDRPDFLFYADFGWRHRLFDGPRIFYSGESTVPDFRRCDYAFTSHYLDDPRHLRLPLYVLYTEAEALLRAPDEHETVPSERRQFCSFVVSNAKDRERTRFFEALSARRPVASGGRFRNNVGGPVADKMGFIRGYRFNIAFENRVQPGYTTEKIVQAMIARCIPIYRGNALIAREFNPGSFLDYADFASEEELIAKVLEIDSDEEQYRRYHREPYFHGNRPSEYFDRDRLLDQFERIFTGRIRPVGRRRPWFRLAGWLPGRKRSLP